MPELLDEPPLLLPLPDMPELLDPPELPPDMPELPELPELPLLPLLPELPLLPPEDCAIELVPTASAAAIARAAKVRCVMIAVLSCVARTIAQAARIEQRLPARVTRTSRG